LRERECRSAKIIEEECSFSSVSVEPLSERVSEEKSIGDSSANFASEARLAGSRGADKKPRRDGFGWIPRLDGRNDVVLDKVGVLDEL
jgi:hypothetical protein